MSYFNQQCGPSESVEPARACRRFQAYGSADQHVLSAGLS